MYNLDGAQYTKSYSHVSVHHIGS